MSLTTPRKTRDLHIKRYRKAKNEPGYRFYLLYDKIYREVDGQSCEEIESKGLEECLSGIREELRNKTYKPQPVRRVMMSRRGGGRVGWPAAGGQRSGGKKGGRGSRAGGVGGSSWAWVGAAQCFLGLAGAPKIEGGPLAHPAEPPYTDPYVRWCN